MNKLEFACFFHRLQKSLKINIDSDIIAEIYQEYIHKYYEKYTLWQLISMLDEQHVYIGCKHSKNSIIKMISDGDLNIPCHKHWYEQPEKTEYEIYNMKYIEYLTSTYGRHVSANMICVTNAGIRTEIMNGDVFYLFDKGNRYAIDVILNDQELVLRCKDDNSVTTMPISKFMEMIDTDANAGVYYNHFRQNISQTRFDKRFYTKNITYY